MDQREFNRQMGSYLRERKSDGGLWKRIKGIIPTVEITSEEDEQQQQEPDEVPVEKVEAVMRGESVEPEEDEDDFAQYEASQEPEGFFERIARWIFGSYDRTELLHEDDVDVAVIEQDVRPEVDADVKQMLRVCVRWINRLPPEEIQAIKREDEYREFKALLEKYGLLKKQ